MIHAYPETSLNKSRSLLAEAFDYAVNSCHISGTDFVSYFVSGPFSKRIENGETAIISGMSGIELARKIIAAATGKIIDIIPEEKFTRSVEYWIGWAVAYYQWWSGRNFSSIFKALGYRDLERMYFTLHEADISKFVEIADAKVKEYYPDTNLKYIRSAYGCSQAELSEMSGVSLRSIQMYEQRNKDINKAGAGTVRSLAKALGCTMEDLLEN